MANKPDLSIIILSYNTSDLLTGCIRSIKNSRPKISYEIVVCDNGSTDGSIENINRKYPDVSLIENGENLGFAKGNNAAKKIVHGEYVLFLNSDTEVHKETLDETVNYLKVHEDVGVVTCKMKLPSGGLDKDARRSFPTPWVALTHLVLKLDKLFPKSPLFARYWYGYKSADDIHEIDVVQGAYFLTTKKILDSVGWFSEDYFLDGEDIDLSWKIKQKGWKCVYYPMVSIKHIKGATKGKNKKTKSSVSLSEKMKYRMSGVNSMEIFYKKRMWKDYPLVINLLVIFGIKAVKLVRFFELLISG